MTAFIAFVSSHLAVFASFGVALLDLLFALIPGLSANGILHQIYLWLTGAKAPGA